MTHPLRIYVCEKCWLVQTEDFLEPKELFRPDYAYFSSTSTSWLSHAKNYAEMIQKKLTLTKNSQVIEIGSNDGYLLKNFVEVGIPCIGIEPADYTAEEAERSDIRVIRKFFGQKLAKELSTGGKQADLIIGNNVFAHVPDINDFTLGLKVALKPEGTITLEFAYVLSLIEKNQFDSVYHEHFSYLSLHAVCSIFKQAGLKVYDVEELSTQGGSLRVYGCHEEDENPVLARVRNQLHKEMEFGLLELQTYLQLQNIAEKVKNNLLVFLIEQKRNGKIVAAYGAAAKGNTLLNYAGVKPDLLPFVCDAAKSKQGKFLPGSHLPIYPPEKLHDYKPDYVLILPWNISEEVSRQLNYIREWGGQFITAVPGIRYLQ